MVRFLRTDFLCNNFTRKSWVSNFSKIGSWTICKLIYKFYEIYFPTILEQAPLEKYWLITISMSTAPFNLKCCHDWLTPWMRTPSQLAKDIIRSFIEPIRDTVRKTVARESLRCEHFHLKPYLKELNKWAYKFYHLEGQQCSETTCNSCVHWVLSFLQDPTSHRGHCHSFEMPWTTHWPMRIILITMLLCLCLFVTLSFLTSECH